MILAEPRGGRGAGGRPARCPDPRHARGRVGEDAAARAIQAAGMTILARRFRIRAGEVDLVALDGGTVVFVEVKTRAAGSRYAPGEAVTRAKQRRLAAAAEAWLTRRRWLDRPARFDVVEVRVPDAGPIEVHHIRDAFHL